MHEGLHLLADTWQPDTGGFVHDGQFARIWLRRAVADLHAREPVAAADHIEAHLRAWLATRPTAHRYSAMPYAGYYGA